MAFIEVISKERVDTAISPYKVQIRDGLMVATANILNKKPQDVIVDFRAFGRPEPENAPDLLMRAETSTWNRHLLDPWKRALDSCWDDLVASLEIPLEGMVRFAVKPYVLDSEWIESIKHISPGLKSTN